jgi:hypothetical protein
MSRRGRGGKNRNQIGGTQGAPGGNRVGRQPKRQSSGQQASGDKSSQTPANGERGTNKNAQFQSALIPRKTLSRPAADTASAAKPIDRRYEVIFFDTLAQAKSDLPRLKTIATECDQLNIIVRAEASMDDPDLTAVGKLFCGAAWALIHDRRKEDGWYDSPQE